MDAVSETMNTLEIAAYNCGVLAVAALAGQVGGLIETEVTAAGACDADSAAMMRRVLDEFARQAAALLKPEPVIEPDAEEA